MRTLLINSTSTANSLFNSTILIQGENLATKIVYELPTEMLGYNYAMVFQLGEDAPVVSPLLVANVDNKIEYTLTNALTNTSGQLKLEVQASDSKGTLLKTSRLTFNVQESINGTTVEVMPESYIPWYTQVVGQVAIAVAKASESKASSDSALISKNTSQALYDSLNASNNSIQSAENIRLASEVTRKSSEVTRVASEVGRVSNEADRTTRFNALTTAQQQASEVVNARTSTVKAKTFASLTARIEEVEVDTTSANYSAELTQNAKVFSLGTGKNSVGADIDVSSSVVNGLVKTTIEGNTSDIYVGGMKSDFVGKIWGSNVENGNIMKISAKNNINNKALKSPLLTGVDEWTEGYDWANGINNVNGAYPKLAYLDGTITYCSSEPIQGVIPQQCFSFNLIDKYERTYGTIPSVDQTVASKVAWLKLNVTHVDINWTGYGSCPSGNKASVGLWTGSAWSPMYIVGNTSSIPTLCKQELRYNYELGVYLQSDGFIHMLAYTDMASTTSPTLLVMTGHGFSQWDIVENATRSLFSQVNGVGGTDRIATESIASQSSGDIINKYHIYNPIAVCLSGTTSTNITINNHGLLVGDVVRHGTSGTVRKVLTVIDINNVTVSSNTNYVVGDALRLGHFVGQQVAEGTCPTVLSLTAHGLSANDVVENVTRNSLVGIGNVTLNAMAHVSVTGQVSGDIINKYHAIKYSPSEVGTTETSIKITAHGLSTGDIIQNMTRSGNRRKITVLDVNTFTVSTPITGQVVGDNIGLFHFIGTQTAETGVIPSTIYTDYISLDITLKPSYKSLGETLVQNVKNETPYNSSTWVEWTKVYSVGDSTGIELTTDGTHNPYLIIPTNLKANTKYGVLLNCISSTIISAPYISSGGAFSPITLTKNVGNFKLTQTTLPTIVTNTLYIGKDTEVSGNKIKFKDIRVFELPLGSQIESDFNNLTADQLNAKYQFAGTGTQYVGGIVQDGKYTVNVTSIGKNLFDNGVNAFIGPCAVTTDGTTFCYKATNGADSKKIKLKANTNYYFKATKNITFQVRGIPKGIFIGNTNIYNNAITPVIGTGNPQIAFNTGIYEDISIRVYNDTDVLNFNIQIIEGIVDLPYTPYVEDARQLILTQPLRRVSPTVADVYKEGQVVRNISDWMALTGDLGWVLDTDYIMYKQYRTSITNALLGYKGTLLDSNGKLLLGDSHTITGGYDIGLGGNAYVYLSIADTDIGFCDNYGPTSAEIKSYFYGYKMCHTDGVSPYQVSEVPYNPTTWAEWTQKTGGIGDSTGLEITSNGSADYRINNILFNVKASTKYGLLYNVLNSTVTGGICSGGEFNWGALPTTIGNNKVIKLSASTPPNRFQIQLASATEPSGNKVKFKDFRVFELPTGSQIETDFNTMSADQLSAKYQFYGLNPKNWKSVVDGSGQTAVLPVAQAPNYTPYKMLYQKATPTVEILNVASTDPLEPSGVLPLASYEKGSMIVDGGVIAPTTKYIVPLNFKAMGMDNNALINSIEKYVTTLDGYTTNSLLRIADRELRMKAVTVLTTETTADLKLKINELINIWKV